MIDISQRVESLRMRFKQVESELSDPSVFDDKDRYQELSKEHQRLSALVECYDRLESAKSELQENKEMLTAESDEELKDMIRLDISSLEEEVPKLEKQLMILIVPPDPNDSRNCIVEIRPAAGGDEAALFAEDLMRMYQLYSSSKGWKIEVLEYTPSDLGGLKATVFSVKGVDVFRELNFESGVHRVQRIPRTETQGRIHTSTVTVAVLPEAEEVDLHIDPKDLKIDTYRSSGAGGQCVNTTDSAVRVTYVPTGLACYSQQERSQHLNKEIAMNLLRAKLLDEKIRKEKQKMADERRGQIGTGDRSERIRTYNYPQSRISDHRFGVSVYNLPDVMAGKFSDVMDKILAIDAEQRLAEEM
ncbi:peptide chain release factor 1 [Lentisphaera profundi]|uniref:Peptide chain release factor 1 n=1 Tax=Lentisphaera profundi TaxID=1658616 RepID=A0ABY7VSJ0_9BACT|nr:peptide chain release factor 1 [Lentisphaera profundi]WDE96709.1 peptide chain release factor 1 [Lentisphaera profundi]